MRMLLRLGFRRGLTDARWDGLALRTGVTVGLVAGLMICGAWLVA